MKATDERCVFWFWVNVLLGLSNLVPLNAQAGEIGVVYLKNGYGKPVSVWINGYYQGWVPSGQTCYTVMEGFVTADSGLDSKGELRLNYDYAGWESQGNNILITTMGPGEEKTTQVFWTAAVAEGSDQFLGSGKARFWVGTKSEITGSDVENASKIRKGRGEGLVLREAKGDTPAEEVLGGGYSGGELIAYQVGEGRDFTFPGEWRVVSVTMTKDGRVFPSDTGGQFPFNRSDSAWGTSIILSEERDDRFGGSFKAMVNGINGPGAELRWRVENADEEKIAIAWWDDTGRVFGWRWRGGERLLIRAWPPPEREIDYYDALLEKVR